MMIVFGRAPYPALPPCIRHPYRYRQEPSACVWKLILREHTLAIRQPGVIPTLPVQSELFGLHGRLPPNNSLDASGGSVFRNLLGAAEGALIRAAASTPPLG